MGKKGINVQHLTEERHLISGCCLRSVFPRSYLGVFCFYVRERNIYFIFQVQKIITWLNTSAGL